MRTRHRFDHGAPCRWPGWRCCVHAQMCDGQVVGAAGDVIEEQVGPSEQRLAVNAATARHITRLSDRQLGYWARTGLVGPSVDRRLTPGRRVRLYGFVDLLA